MIFIFKSILKSILVMLFSFLVSIYGALYAIVDDDPIHSTIKETFYVD